MTSSELGVDPAAEVLRHSADAALLVHPERGVIWASPATENVLGLDPSDLVGARDEDYLHPEHLSVARHHHRIALSRGHSGPEELRGRHGRHGHRWYSVDWWGLRPADRPDEPLVVVHLRDAEEVRNARAAILRSEARLLRLHRTSMDITMILNPAGSTTYLSPSVERILGWNPDHVLSGDPFDLVHPEDRDRVEQIRSTMLSLDQSTYEGEVRVLHLDGRYRWMEIHAVNLLSDPVVNGAVVHLHDITDRRNAEDELARAALHDDLTGLASYALMRDRITLALTRHGSTTSETVAVVVVDLDAFASLNDTLGHEVGDAVLTEAADRLRRLDDQGATVGRFAGDEFAICLELPTGPHVAVDRAEAIRSMLSEPYLFGDRSHRLTCSAGLAIAGPGADAEALLRDASAAMHQAKGRGRNRTEIFDTADRSAMLDELNLQTDLDRAIAADQLLLEFQPAFDTSTGHVSGVEALVRWMHPERGLLPPGAFIGAAERSDRIIHLGQWVADTAVSTASDLARTVRSAPPVMWINVAAPQLADPGFAAELLRTLERAGLDPARFGLEVTESALIDSRSSAEQELRTLRSNGCQLALDDFGTGYSSLTYLHQFEIDVIKIDRSFVAGLGRDRRSESIVDAVTSMGEAMGLRVVAEGVETLEQLRILESLRCSDVSGFGLVRPLREEQLRGVLDRTLADVMPGSGLDPVPSSALPN